MTVDYNSVNRQLISAGAGVLASESHGFLCGVFCASNTVASAIWQEYLLVGVENSSDFDESFAVLAELAKIASEEIVSEEMIFTPFLPDDQASIAERSNSISEWCAGFVSGLGIGRGEKTLDLDDEGDEFLQDIISISRMGSSNDEGDDSEAAYFEVVEYIRVGVIFIYQQLHETQKRQINTHYNIH
jgi:yecA family protein